MEGGRARVVDVDTPPARWGTSASTHGPSDEKCRQKHDQPWRGRRCCRSCTACCWRKAPSLLTSSHRWRLLTTHPLPPNRSEHPLGQSRRGSDQTAASTLNESPRAHPSHYHAAWFDESRGGSGFAKAKGWARGCSYNSPCSPPSPCGAVASPKPTNALHVAEARQAEAE